VPWPYKAAEHLRTIPEMSDLDDLLKAAEAAGPVNRIEYRDRIAAHGAAAIAPLRRWLQAGGPAAFAIRTLVKIADDPAIRPHVLDALRSVDRRLLPEATAMDVNDALGQLGGGRASRAGDGARTPASEAWPGSRAVSNLERRFHDDMLDIFRLAGEATRQVRPDGSVIRGYWASYFLRGVRNHGGPDYARQLLRKPGTTPGFERLREEGRLDLTVEALVLRPEYATLFTDEERRIAAHRLAEAGYQGRKS
jgi:hypothetical protein